MPLPFIIIFISTLIFSTFFLISSSHWLLIWAIFEINLLSFIPLISISQKNQETERSIKYFLAQATGSRLIVTVTFLIFSTPIQIRITHQLIYVVFIISILLKLGVGPTHFWFPSVMVGLSWPIALLLSTWQKIGPLAILRLIKIYGTLIIVAIVGILSALIGGVGGLNQTDMRALLAYSSIGHLGWIIITINISTKITIIYFFIYCIMIMPLFFILWKTNINKTRFSNNIFSKSTIFWILLIFFSLGGVPPFLGFFPKWLIFTKIIESRIWVILRLLITGALINIFYYLSVIFSSFFSKRNNNNTKTKITTNTTIIIIFGMTTTPLIPIIFIYL